MADIINLNRARKARARAQDQVKAVENRARFGRTKEQKAADRAAKEQVERALDGAKRSEP